MIGRKKGGLHTIEAVIAFIMVLSFIVFVMPALVSKEDASALRRNYVYGALSNMEKTGKLNELAAAENLSGIVIELNKTLRSPTKFTIGMSKLNITTGTLYPKESQSETAYINFAANTSTLDYATLEMEYVNATDPVVNINGNGIANHTGDYSQNSETLDITSEIIMGSNSISVTTQNNATINYRLRHMASLELGKRPAGKAINTVNYMLAGDGTVLMPMEVRVYIWR